MRWHRRVLAIGLCLVCAVALGAPSAVAESPPGCDIERQGTLDGAAFRICVPAEWNGTLLVWARGYAAVLPLPEVAPPGTEGALLAEGYALAGSAFRSAGWAIKDGAHDTLVLTEYFREQIAEPERVILYGQSMGSVIVLDSIEQHKGVYDGAVSMCSLGAGATKHWDLRLDIALAYDVAFGWPASWGTVGDVRDDINFGAEVFPVYYPQITSDANKGLFEFIRLVNDLPSEGFYPPGNIMFLHMFLMTAGRAELESRAGGPVTQNLDHVYSLTPAKVSYLEGLGVDAADLLAQMNAQRGFAAAPSARNYLEHYGDFGGKIAQPVLTLHTHIDGLAPAPHAEAYRETVTAAGRDARLAQAYTNGVGHCTFTPAQIVASIEAMDAWIATGQPPTPDAFPEAIGFVHGWAPGPWPQPPP